MEKDKRKKNDIPTIFKAGAVSLAFLIIGYQTALFIHRASVERVAAVRDHPDTVFVIDPALAAELLDVETVDERPQLEKKRPQQGRDGNALIVRRNAAHSEPVRQMREMKRRTETFRFNPNTVSVEDLQRLGFSEKQAQTIDNYRQKGGRFRRKSDFAKSFVVSDSVFSRLEQFIDIPPVDINRADSAAFDDLPGIGGYFAKKIVEYRKALGGYSYPEQLMDIRNFDREKFDALSDLICCSPPKDSFDLWTLPPDSLRMHPYIRSWQTARAIVLFRDNNPRSGWTVEALGKAGILRGEDASRLSGCAIRHSGD